MENIILFYFLYFIISIGVACIFGAITKGINESKGYYGGFAWGFWLGWIGIIVVACRASNSYSPRESIIKPANSSAQNNIPAHIASSQQAAPNSWKCRCGRYNAQFVSSCTCGLSKREALAPEPKPVPAAPVVDEAKNIAALKEYKELLDAGVITQEEFDAKKKEILSR